MAPARWSGLVVVLALALAPAASAQTGPCPPGSPAPVFTVNGSQSGPVYTTHDLLALAKLAGGAYFTVDAFDVSGIRRLPHPDGDESPPDEVYGVADLPGTLTDVKVL